MPRPSTLHARDDPSDSQRMPLMAVALARNIDFKIPLHLRGADLGTTIFSMQARSRKEPVPSPRGRPREGEEAMVPVSVKMQPKQKEKLQRLGGAPWVRGQIDKAKEPK